jgi:hypothetical protein
MGKQEMYRQFFLGKHWKIAICKNGKISYKGFKYLATPHNSPELGSFLNTIIKTNVKCGGIYGGRWGIMVVAGILKVLNTTECGFIN